MEWLSNNWIFVGLVACVVILLGLFGRGGRERDENKGSGGATAGS
jgi:hypothetical protein